MPSLRFTITAALSILVFAACAHASDGEHGAARATATSASASRGAALFATNCASCHGARGSAGRIGPSLRDEHKRKSERAIRAVIVDPDPPMPKLYPAQLSAQDVDDLTAYVETL